MNPTSAPIARRAKWQRRLARTARRSLEWVDRTLEVTTSPATRAKLLRVRVLVAETTETATPETARDVERRLRRMARHLRRPLIRAALRTIGDLERERLVLRAPARRSTARPRAPRRATRRTTPAPADEPPGPSRHARRAS